MDDFYKQFRDNLENRPEPPFSEGDWKDLEMRLDAQGKKRRGFFSWWWIVAPVLFLLMGSNTLFFFGLKKANEKLSALELRKDTVFQTKLISKTDTFFQTKILYSTLVEYVPASFAPSLTTAQLQPFLFDEPGSSTVIYKKQSPLYRSEGSLNPTFTIQPTFKENINDSTNEILKDDAPDRLITLDMAKLERRAFLDMHDSSELLLRENDLRKRKQKRAFSDHLYTLIPKKFQAGLSGGFAYPFKEDLSHQSGYSAGLQASAEFSPTIGMWMDVSYFKINFETTQMDETLGVPVIDSTLTNFKFMHARVPQVSIQYSVGLNYIFNTGGKWKPFAGVGYGAVSVLPHEVVYEYSNEDLGIDWNLDARVERKELFTNFLLLRAGLDYKISDHLNMQLRASYRSRNESKGFQFPEIIGLQSGLMYRL
jgi:hypothetical protein